MSQTDDRNNPNINILSDYINISSNIMMTNNRKKDKRLEQTLHKRRYAKGQEAYQKLLNIRSHQRNARHKNEIALHTQKKG